MVHTLSLAKNAAKPGWEDMSINDLRHKLREEYAEVQDELWRLENTRFSFLVEKSYQEQYKDKLRKRIIAECVDLANVCMMIADNVGGLKDD